MSRALLIGRQTLVDQALQVSVEATANRAHTADVTIRTAAAAVGPVDPETGIPELDSDVIGTGTARIRALSVPEETAAAGDEIRSRRYLVQMALAAAPAAGYVLHVDASADPTLVGRDLIIRSVTRSTLAGQRDLVCTLQGQDVTP